MKKLTKKLGMSTLALASVFTLGFASAKSVDSNVQSISTQSTQIDSATRVNSRNMNGVENADGITVTTENNYGASLQYTLSSTSLTFGFNINVPASVVTSGNSYYNYVTVDADGNEVATGTTAATSLAVSGNATSGYYLGIDKTTTGVTGLTASSEYTTTFYASNATYTNVEDATKLATITYSTLATGETAVDELTVTTSTISNLEMTSSTEVKAYMTLSPTAQVETGRGGTDFSLQFDGYLPSDIVGEGTTGDDNMYTVKMDISESSSTKDTNDLTLIFTGVSSDANPFVSINILDETEGLASYNNTDWTNSAYSMIDALIAYNLNASETYEVTFSVSSVDNFQSWEGTGSTPTETTVGTWTEWFSFSFDTNATFTSGQVAAQAGSNNVEVPPAVTATMISYPVDPWEVNNTSITAIVLASIFGVTTIGLGAYIVVNNNKAKKAKAHTSTSHTTK